MQYRVIGWLVAWVGLPMSIGIAAPLDCVPVKTKVVNHNLVIETLNGPTEAGQLYFFKNNSQKSLWLDRLGKQSIVNAGWTSYLRTQNWSALFLNKKEFMLSCAVIQPGKLDYVNCGQALTVCTPTHVMPNTKRKGSYWLAEDKPWDVFSKLMAKHIIA